jgi:rhodanese-related sulfurtransferase
MQVPTVEVTGLPDPVPTEGWAVVDVREPAEWDAGHVAGAVHIPMFELAARVSELPHEQRLLMVCQIGGRSARATAYLVQQGYDAVNLAGGMVEWHEAGRPLVSETGQPPRVL